MGHDTDRRELIQRVQQLRFGRAVGPLYALLLTDGPLAPDSLSAVTREPTPAIARALDRLIRLRLVGTDVRRGRLHYYATDPSLAWLALVADLVWGTNVELRPVRALPETNNPDVESLRMLCNEISELAQRLYRPQAATASHRERDAESQEEMARLICEIIQQAEREVLAVSPSPRLPQVASFWVVLTDRMEHGVAYRRIVDLDEIIDHGLLVKSRDMNETGVDLSVLEHDRLDKKYYLVDKKYVAIFDRNGGNNTSLLGRITNHLPIVMRYRKNFRKYAEDAIPGRFVVEYLNAAARQLIERARLALKPIEAAWIEDLVKYGRFSKFEDWQPARIAAVASKAAALGLVRRNFDGEIVPAYPTNERELRDAYRAAAQRERANGVSHLTPSR
jgi:DNA-binding transcriptional regulator GbsR (MarR family)